jgi:small-conductance mechanosensitive channel
LEILDQTFFGNALLQWIIAGSVAVVTLLTLGIVQRVGGRYLAALAARTTTQWDDRIAATIAKTSRLFLLVVSLFAGSLLLELTESIRAFLANALVIAVLLQTGIWANALLLSLLESYRQRLRNENPAATSTVNILGVVGKIVLWTAVLLLSLDNLGVDITSLVAGLGIGGVAVALAVQNVLGDLFASLSIALDKPFVHGDFLAIGDFLGSVEYIGLKTTRIRSLSGEQLVFSNSDLLSSRIRNYGRMYERRVVFNLGVTYQTPRAKLQLVPQIIEQAVSAQKNTRFDRSHFMQYGDYALHFESVYYVISPDYNTYMDIQQAIYFTIHERFEQEHIDFAYPTQTLLVAQNADSCRA